MLRHLPADLRAWVLSSNGFVAYDGGFHLRGASHAPSWHSLAHAWTGPACLHETYPAVLAEDIPFAEDCVGDQFLLRDGAVLRLDISAGTVEDVSRSLAAFQATLDETPESILRLDLVREHERRVAPLEPHQVLAVYRFGGEQDGPPGGLSLTAADRLEVLQFNADFFRGLH